MFIARTNAAAGSADMSEDPLFLVFNAGEDCTFTLPHVNGIKKWKRIADTGAEDAFAEHPAEPKAMVYESSIAIFAPA